MMTNHHQEHHREHRQEQEEHARGVRVRPGWGQGPGGTSASDAPPPGGGGGDDVGASSSSGHHPGAPPPGAGAVAVDTIFNTIGAPPPEAKKLKSLKQRHSLHSKEASLAINHQILILDCRLE